MKNMKWVSILVGVVALALLGLSVVAAQDSTPEATPDAMMASTPGYLGVRYVAADSGVLIVEVVADSPAAVAGVKVGDLLLTVNGDTVTADTVRDAIQAHAAGDTLTLGVERRGEAMDVNVTLAEYPTVAPQTRFTTPDVTSNTPYLGIGISLDENGGIVIGEVVDGSPAADAGLQVGDVITQVNGSDVATPQDVVAAVQALNVGDSITLTVDRAGETQQIEATVGSTTTAVPFGRDFGRGNFSLNNGTIGLEWVDGQLQVTELSEDNPLYTAGLRAGDTITAVNGQALSDANGLLGLFRDMETDSSVTLTVQRDGAAMDVDVPVAVLIEGFHFYMMPNGMDMPGFFDGRGFHGYDDSNNPQAEATQEPNA
ncbi:MAG: PDZ domain-containing protein [Anaerolineaceae bacterium]|nr:PDZ domain-containing protein [Anaerolineaceae bacterium]